jgi:hypothetical protein
MRWNAKLSETIKLKDGRELLTLRDAAKIVLGLPEKSQARAGWQHAGKLLLDAAEMGDAESIKEATDQVWRALKAEGLI